MRGSSLLLLLGLSSPVMADFTDVNNGAAAGNAAMQQSRQVAGTGQAYGNSDGNADGFTQGAGNADGEATFSITFNGKGLSDVENALSQSRSFDGSLYQARMLNAQGMGNAYTNAYFYPYYHPYEYPYAFPIPSYTAT